jgi:MFS family permease
LVLLDWLSQDGKLLLLAKGSRTFSYGFISVLLPYYLTSLNFSSWVGFVFTTTLVGTAVAMIAVIFRADRFGRKRSLLIFGILMSLSGVLFVSFPVLPIIFLAAFIGNIGATGSETGSFLSIEQAILPSATTEAHRNDSFSLYNLVGYGGAAFGALFAAATTLLQGMGLTPLQSYQALFGVFAVLGGVVTIAYLALSSRVEETGNRIHSPVSIPTRPIVAKLSTLFALDAFGGGLVIQGILSDWFLVHFNARPEQTGIIFFLASIITAITIALAPRIAHRIGLVNTMVFAHLPSNILLASIPFAPTFATASLLLFARQSLSQIDVPSRQSYIMAIVPEADRTGTASITNLSRSTAQSIGPSISGSLIQAGLLYDPFLLAGGLKIVYDLSLYFSFRRLKPPEEAGSRQKDSNPKPPTP